MKRVLAAFTFCLVFAVAGLPSVDAAGRENGGDGYASANHKELSNTIVFMGGVDITKSDVADDYAKMFYCEQYKKYFSNDLEWHKIRAGITSRIKEKKDFFRTLYETYGIFNLGRYDLEGQFFPLSQNNVPMVNVGSMLLSAYDDEYRPYCGFRLPSNYFPANISLVLNQPLTLNKFRITMDQVKVMLARMDKLKNADRTIYARIRFRITEAPGPVAVKDRVVRSEVKGELTSIRFFLDREMTQPVGGEQLPKK